MGILTTIRQAAALTRMVDHVAPESAWASPNHLATITAPDYWPAEGITRASAMRVPAVARARTLIVTNIAQCPLVALDGAGVLPTEFRPTWLDRTDGPISPFHRMLNTADDLFFYGWSAWAVERDASGEVAAADRIPYDDWTIDPEGHVIYKDQQVATGTVILIPGITEGILTVGAAAITHARTLARAVATAANTPVTNVVLKQVAGEPITRAKAQEIVSDYVKARTENGHGVTYVSANIELIEAGKRDPALLIDGRNAAAVDIARVTGIPATLLDATTPGGSNTYVNTQARLQELVDFGLAPYMSAIAARLGLDDVVPAGTRIEFDTSPLVSVAGGNVSVPDDGPAPAPTPVASVQPKGA